MIGLANFEAEVSVLGSIFLEGSLFTELDVQAEHFYHAEHQVIFRAMKQVADAERKIDMVSVVTQLGDALSQVGGSGRLLEMAGICTKS